MSDAISKETMREQHQEEMRQIQQAYQQSMVTIDSLKQRLFDLEMQIVDSISEKQVLQAQVREMQVALQKPPISDTQMSNEE